MKNIIKYLTVTLSVLLGFVQAASASESEPVDTGKVVAQLVSSHYRASPGQTIDVALRTVLDEHWHTYWRNPGDSGEAVQISWSLPEGVTSGEITWPLPQAIPTGPIVNYGFEGTPLFPVPLTLSSDLKVGQSIVIEADAYYLVCKDICIPESAELSLQIQIGEPQLNERWNNLITLAKRRAPKEGSIRGTIGPASEKIQIGFTNLPEGRFEKAFFFPYKQGVVLPASPQEVSLGADGLTLSTDGDFLWENDLPTTLQGVLAYERDKRRVGEILTLDVIKGSVGPAVKPQSSASSLTFFSALIGAFIGGLILNLMPCVFPVISIKALSLAKIAHEDKAKIRREGWLYTFGVLAMFGLLTTVLLILKQTGAEIGWGFQLQSPIIVGLLSLLFFSLGLNLLGFFELGTGLQNIGGGLTSTSGGKGAFFTGALAVIVATPCTAPFMAGAIGFALAQPSFVTVLVFLGLAIGFALPFLVLAYAPALLKRLPKPGPWMVRFKEFLAFPMLLAVIWLVWVLTVQSGQDGLIKVLLAMVAIGFAVWVLKLRGMLAKALGGLALIFAIFSPLTLTNAVTPDSVNVAGAEVWSPERIAALQADGNNVFVDFTAAWCVTCKVNERLVLNTDKAKALFAETNTVKMIADWTNKNDEIAQELERHGRSGVPLYLLYKSDNKDVNPQILPQILSQSVLETYLRGEN